MKQGGAFAAMAAGRGDVTGVPMTGLPELFRTAHRNCTPEGKSSLLGHI
jgi:hypothetical protein